MKKLISIALVTALLFTFLPGCDLFEDDPPAPTAPPSSSAVVPPTSSATAPPTSAPTSSAPTLPTASAGGISMVVDKVEGDRASLTLADMTSATLAAGTEISEGDIITTLSNSFVYLQVGDGCTIKLDEYSELKVSGLEEGDLWLDLGIGSVMVNERSRSFEDFHISAGAALLVVKGTFFTMNINTGRELTIDLLEGSVDVHTRDDDASGVAPGSRIVVSDNDISVSDVSITSFSSFTREAVLEFQKDLGDSCLVLQDFDYLHSVASSINLQVDDIPYSDGVTDNLPTTPALEALKRVVEDAGYYTEYADANALTMGMIGGFSFIYEDGDYENYVVIIEMEDTEAAEFMVAIMVLSEAKVIIKGTIVAIADPEGGESESLVEFMETLVGAPVVDPADWEDWDGFDFAIGGLWLA